MTIKRILLAVAALVCVAIGFIGAQQIDRVRHERRVTAIEDHYRRELAEIRAEGERWGNAVALSQGETVLRAFTAGISPATLAGRREAIELAAVTLLHVRGIAGIHVLGLDGAVLYSSDAKLSTTGDAEYRGAWAMQVSELTSRPSTRPDVVDIAVPIVNAGKPLAVAWLEYDVTAVREAARPAALGTTSDSSPGTADPPADAH